jgi:RNA polymerase sigma-70 factor (ECF subfamily)
VSTLSDAELVARARSGAQEAYRELLARYERPVFSLIVRMVREPALAEDLAQEAFIKVFRSLASYDPALKLSSWIFKIAHNVTIDHLRRKPLDTVPLESPDDEAPGPLAVLADEREGTPEEATLRADLRRALEAGLAKLRPDYRGVLVLRFQEGLAYEEIAEVTGLPLGTVKTHIHRARKELAGVMTAMGWTPPAEGRNR